MYQIGQHIVYKLLYKCSLETEATSNERCETITLETDPEEVDVLGNCFRACYFDVARQITFDFLTPEGELCKQKV